MNSENNLKIEKEFSQQEIYEHVEKRSHSNFYTRFLTRYPCCVILIITLFAFFSIAILYQQDLIKMTPNTSRDYLIWSDFRVQRNDLFDLAKLEVQGSQIDSQGNVPLRVQQQDLWTLSIIYQSRSGNSIFTPENIQKMKEFENYMKSMENKKYEKFCLATSNIDSSCNKNTGQMSIADKFASISQADITNTLNLLTQNQKLTSLNQIYFDKYLGQNNVSLSQRTRSIYAFGSPLDIDGIRYKSADDRLTKQKDIISSWQNVLYDNSKNYETEDMEILLLSVELSNYLMNEQSNKDFLWAGGSFVFVLLYMCIHTRSLTMPIIGMIQVLLAFPIAFFFYSIVFKITYFNQIHLIVIFIILGIAADNIFVYMDTWEQSYAFKPLRKNLIKRVTFVFRKASKTMLVTTITTAFAFIATGTSKIMPISTFGYFAATLVASNFLLVISNFPAWIIFREKIYIWRNKKQYEENDQENDKIIKSEQDDLNVQNYNGNMNNKEQQPSTKIFESCDYLQSVDENIKNKAQNCDEKISSIINDQNNNQKLNKNQISTKPHAININQQLPQKKYTEDIKKIEKFFRNQWNIFIFKFRYIFLIIFIAWLIVACVYASIIQPPQETENFLPESHSISRALKAQNFLGAGNNAGLQVRFVWGLKKIDTSNTNKYDPENLGKLVWDDSFAQNAHKVEIQNKFIEICEKLQGNTNLVSSFSDQESCFMLQFRKYVQNNKGQDKFPVQNEENFYQWLKEFKQTQAGYIFIQNFGIGLINNKLKFVSIIMVAKGQKITPRKKMMPLFEKWENFFYNDINKNVPQSMKTGFQTAGISWQWMVSEDAIQRNAINGMLMAFGLAYAVLIVFTMNIILSTFAIISIGGIAVGVLAVFVYLGWDLGIMESVTSIVVIGFSVDYVVHLGNHYIDNDHNLRFNRIQDALTEMGISILGGSITTLGAGLFLYFCVVVFFFKFAVGMTVTIAFSLLWSLVFFASVCQIWGPQYEQGNIKPYLTAIYSKCRPNKQQQMIKLNKNFNEKNEQPFENNNIELQQLQSQNNKNANQY